ncbi:MAG: GAF domain-containing sensor histidine kinase [Rubricoccaceae bacterium]|nr:GAF domain-containing sensor histidine kinase [Rubricoccaceae bacterium]
MPTDDQQRLEALKRFFVLDHTESEDVIARLVRVAAQVYGVGYAVLTLRDGEGERIAATHGFDGGAVPPDAVFCERDTGPAIPLTVADALDDERFAKNPLVHGSEAARFYAGVPLKSADGFTLGTLAILDPTAQELNGEGLALLVDLGALVEPALTLQQVREAQAEAERGRTAAEQAHAEAEAAREQAEDRIAQLQAQIEATRAELEMTQAERDASRSDGDALQAAFDALRREHGALRDGLGDHEALLAERAALADERDALLAERERLTAALDEAEAKREAAAAERDEAAIGRQAAQAAAQEATNGHEAALRALQQRERLSAAAADAAALLAADPGALHQALARVAPETRATRAALVVKAEAGPAVAAEWHAEGVPPLAQPGELLDADALDAWADAHGVEHLEALPLPTGLVLLDTDEPSPHDEAGFRAAFAPLALHRRSSDGRDRNRLLAGVSHEVRTALTSILGYAEVLGEEAGEEARSMVQRILGSSTRLLQTLDTVLDIARLEASGGPDAMAPVDVGALVEAAAEPFRAHADARDLAFFAAGTEPGTHAWADPAALHRALAHLLANAFTFTDQGGVRLRVYAEDGGVGIEVQDTGVGIAPEFLPHLFDEFRREDAERGRDGKGSGLGLALTKRLVDLMGGEITVTSLKGQGSVFRILLRAAPAPETSAPEAAGVPGGDGAVHAAV